MDEQISIQKIESMTEDNQSFSSQIYKNIPPPWYLIQRKEKRMDPFFLWPEYLCGLAWDQMIIGIIPSIIFITLVVFIFYKSNFH